MREIWEKFFAGKSHTGTVHVDGITRPMTPEEMRLSDEAFGAMDGVFEKHGKLFEEARRENRRRKV